MESQAGLWITLIPGFRFRVITRLLSLELLPISVEEAVQNLCITAEGVLNELQPCNSYPLRTPCMSGRSTKMGATGR